MTYKDYTGTYQQQFLEFQAQIQDVSNYLELEIFRAVHNIYIEYHNHKIITKIHLSELTFLEMYNIALSLNISNELLVINEMICNKNASNIEQTLENLLDKIITYITSKKSIPIKQQRF